MGMTADDELRTLRHRMKELESLVWRLHREPFVHPPEVGAIAKTTSAFAARTSALASGTVQLYTVDEDGDVATSGGADTPAFNNAMNVDGPIAIDTQVIVMQVLGDRWVIVWVECADS